MTPLHTRHKGFRDLYQANPSSKTSKAEKAIRDEERRIKKEVAEAHKEFWKRRGYSTPPRVSKKRVGDFDTPFYNAGEKSPEPHEEIPKP